MGLCEGFVLKWSLRAGKHCKEIMAAYWHLKDQSITILRVFQSFSPNICRV